MRTKNLLLLAVIAGIILSCASTKPRISALHESIIGTKWHGAAPNSGDFLHFVDKKFCISTSNGRSLRFSYTVNGNKVILGRDILSYELRENILYLIGYPAYYKTAL